MPEEHYSSQASGPQREEGLARLCPLIPLVLWDLPVLGVPPHSAKNSMLAGHML